jgi:hypothetical protein
MTRTCGLVHLALLNHLGLGSPAAESKGYPSF